MNVSTGTGSLNNISYSDLKKKTIAEKLIDERGIRKERPRALSNHIVSRYYRSPEIILMEKHYDAGIDIWSAGCIFAELLISVNADKTLSQKDKILFPGKSCYPLSPGTQKS